MSDIQEGDGKLEFQICEDRASYNDRRQNTFMCYAEPNRQGQVAQIVYFFK